jgi:hypothetical protein
MLIHGQVGEVIQQSPGVDAPVRLGAMGELVIQQGSGRFYEQAYRGRLYSGFMANTVLSANTITLSATTTPIIGLWNPLTSLVNLVVLQIGINLSVVANAAVNPGSIVLAGSTGNGALTLGLLGWNRKTLGQAGSTGKYFTIATALTGLTTTLVIFDTITEAPTWVAAAPATAVGAPSVGGTYNVDGSLIIPPGGIICALNTISSTTVNVESRILWAEVPI